MGQKFFSEKRVKLFLSALGLFLFSFGMTYLISPYPQELILIVRSLLAALGMVGIVASILWAGWIILTDLGDKN